MLIKPLNRSPASRTKVQHMTSNLQDNIAANTAQDTSQQTKQPNDKEYNFRMQEQRYQRMLEQERAARLEAEKKAEEYASKKSQVSDDDEDDEPYVGHKKLNKTLAKFGEQTQKQTQNEIQKAVHTALTEERKQNWIKSNPDFYDVLQKADIFAQKNPELAETILEMPDTFERQKLVYKNIKAMGFDKPEQKGPGIQDKIDANRRSPYYQPSGVSAAPYAGAGDYSPAGQKNAYAKLQELKSRLRI